MKRGCVDCRREAVAAINVGIIESGVSSAMAEAA
jgi:hypothetical protein